MSFTLLVVVSVGLALLVGLLPAWIVQWRDDRRLIRSGRIATLSCGGYILKRTAKGAAVSPPKPASAGRRDELAAAALPEISTPTIIQRCHPSKNARRAV